jgi:outer membrane protein OmpA-like peptidoglycan-associated protein
MSLRNDATREKIPVAEPRPLRSVVARQGQVLLDTDVNEVERLLLDRTESADAAMLGAPDRLVFPAGATGFAIGGAPPNLTIGAGWGYLNGWQLFNTTATTLANQPHPWTGGTTTGPLALVLSAQVRHLDPAEDTALSDVALGDAQASGRALNDWRVFPWPTAATTTCETITSLAEWEALTKPSNGTLAFKLGGPSASTDPCSLTPAGGHSRFENLLYRIEVHGGVTASNHPDGPRFGVTGAQLKLSRRNASLMARITKVTGNQITVSPPALDPRAWFAQGAYAEIVGPGDDLDPTPALSQNRLFPITLATDEIITLDITGLPLPNIVVTNKWFLRLWDAWPDGKGLATVPASGGPIDLGDGLAVQLAGGPAARLRRGDHWTAPVRADGSIAWPDAETANPQQQTPHGPAVRYAPLAILNPASGQTDCRIPFATLTDRSLLYRGGDGQSAFAPSATGATPVTLPQTLRVAVMRGATPVSGAKVTWRSPAGAPPSWINGTLVPGGGVITSTLPDGLAEVTWAIDAAQQATTHRLEVVLMSGAGLANTPAVQFNARFDSAAQTSYKPTGKCPTLTKATNVQDALDALCDAIDDFPTLRLAAITLLGGKHKGVKQTELIQDNLILNALEVDAAAFLDGVAFSINSQKLDVKLQAYDPAVEISLDLPYPTTDPERVYWLQTLFSSAPALAVAGASVLNQAIPFQPFGAFGFNTIRLDGELAVKKEVLLWRPSAHAVRFLSTAIQHRFGARLIDDRTISGAWDPKPPARVLCRLRVRSALVFGDDAKTKSRVWLNAEHLGTQGPVTGRELLTSVRDPQRAADLDMYIWLRLPEDGIVFYFDQGSAKPVRSNIGTVEDGVNATLVQRQQVGGGQVELKAKADDPGTKPLNKALSEKRGQGIRDILVAAGLPASAIAITSLGNEQPTFPPLTPDAAETLNRRVEVLLHFKP